MAKKLRKIASIQKIRTENITSNMKLQGMLVNSRDVRNQDDPDNYFNACIDGGGDYNAVLAARKNERSRDADVRE